MKILINCSNLRVGGGLQVAHSFLHEIKSNIEHDFLVVLSENLQPQINKDDFGRNFQFVNYSIKPSVAKTVFGRDKKLDDLEHIFQPEVVFSVFGPTYWRPKTKHICGFAKPDYIYKDSPYFKQISLFQKMKLSAMEFFHMSDFKRNNDLLITENPDVTRILAQKVPQKVVTVTNFYNQIFEDELLWDKSIQINESKETLKLLTISANYPHKNLAIIKKVIPVLKKQFPSFQFKFFLTIDRSEFGISETDSLNQNIEFLGKVAINQCPSLYSQCDFLFLPTLLECFSASYCEAMFMQKPILTSNLSFATGICGKAAQYFNPMDENDIANTIYELATNNELQNEIKTFGIPQLKTFDSSQIRAKKYIELITSKDAIKR